MPKRSTGSPTPFLPPGGSGGGTGLGLAMSPIASSATMAAAMRFRVNTRQGYHRSRDLAAGALPNPVDRRHGQPSMSTSH